MPPNDGGPPGPAKILEHDCGLPERPVVLEPLSEELLESLDWTGAFDESLSTPPPEWLAIQAERAMLLEASHPEPDCGDTLFVVYDQALDGEEFVGTALGTDAEVVQAARALGQAQLDRSAELNDLATRARQMATDIAAAGGSAADVGWWLGAAEYYIGQDQQLHLDLAELSAALQAPTDAGRAARLVTLYQAKVREERDFGRQAERAGERVTQLRQQGAPAAAIARANLEAQKIAGWDAQVWHFRRALEQILYP